MKNQETLKKLAEELFSLMGTKTNVEVSWNEESESLVVDLDAGDETGLLIGRKGETLAGIQLVLAVMLKQKVGEWNRVLVNIGDYREKEEDYLKNLAVSAAERAKETGEPQSLYNLKSGQRRIIHMYLSEDPEIETESQGEGRDRYLLVKSKKA